jgi:hypothetical protein
MQVARNIPRGELVLALVFAALGVLWVAVAVGLPMWEGFAPQSGLMPLAYGVLLTALSVAVIATLFVTGGTTDAQPIGKPILVLATLTAAILGVEPAGFAPAVFLMLLFLFVIVEKLPMMRSIVVAAGTTAFLVLVFRTWLGVPLPIGPLGL